MKVADLLAGKGSTVKTIEPTASIRTLAQKLKSESIGAMVVSADQLRIVGIISELDVVPRYADYGPAVDNLTVADLMTRGVITCKPEDKISEVSRVMTNRRIRHLPVKNGDRLVGLVSIGDVLKHRIDEIQLEANVLRDYAIAHR